MEQATSTIVRAMYDAYGRADFAVVEKVLHDEVDWIVYAPIAVFPFAGSRRGKQAVLQVLASIGAEFAIERYDTEIVIVEGDRAAVMSMGSFKQRATGRLIRIRLANFLRFEGGKLVEFREFMDSFDAVEQTLGHWLDTAAVKTAT